MTPSSPVKLSVVAPLHNEEGNVQALYEDIRATMQKLGQPYEIIFVNDASSDQTLSLLQRIADRDSAFHYADLAFNVGENWALLAGISRAAGEIIITIDGDYQNDPAYIPALLERLSEGYRVVSGWRRNRVGGLWTRRLPSQVANALICASTGIAVHDCGCGLKAYRKEVVQGKYVPKGFMNRFSPAVLGIRPQEFSEVEIVDRTRKAGASHYGLGRVFVVFRDLFTLPFALRGPKIWLPRFRLVQWLLLVVLIPLVWWHQWLLAVVVGGLLLLCHLIARNLQCFVEAQSNPMFRIRKFR